MDAPTIIEYKCFFCNSKLSVSVELSDFDIEVYICDLCPKTDSEYLNKLWKCPHVIQFSDKIIEKEYLYFDRLGKWLEMYYDRNMMCISKLDGHLIVSLNFIINIREYSAKQLEDKIKTWLLLI